MKSTMVLGVAAALAVAMAAPRAARACGQGGGNYTGLAVLAGVAASIGVMDTGLLLWDGGSALASHRPSKGYAIFELVVAAPQLALGTASTIAALTEGSRPDPATPYIAAYTAAMGILVWHAIWTLANQPATEPEPEYEARSTRTSKPATLAKVSLGPTYVPVGQQAHPGFGLVGRF